MKKRATKSEPIGVGVSDAEIDLWSAAHERRQELHAETKTSYPGPMSEEDEDYCDLALRMTERVEFALVPDKPAKFLAQMARRWNCRVTEKQRQWLDGLAPRFGLLPLDYAKAVADSDELTD